MLTAVTGSADHVRRNRAVWDRLAAVYAGPGLRLWAASEPTWGNWNVPEPQAGVLPADLEGRDSIERGGAGDGGGIEGVFALVEPWHYPGRCRVIMFGPLVSVSA